MIRFSQVSRKVIGANESVRGTLEGINLVLPVNRKVAVFGTDRAAMTTFLHLLAGSEVPDRGSVVIERHNLSPIVNSGGGAGSNLLPQLTAMENVRFFARLHGLDALALKQIIEWACHFGSMWDAPIRLFDWPRRRALETALIAALPYDCYLVDHLHTMAGELCWLLATRVRERRAGWIFTTDNFNVAQKFGEVCVVIEDRNVHVFPTMAQARSAYAF